MNIKMDWIKVISFAGTLLGMAGTVASGYAQQKDMTRTIDQKVAEAISKVKIES